MWNDRKVLDLLGIEQPIIQAPMAGATNVLVVTGVSNAGGLGSLGAAGTPPAKLREQVTAIREGTGRPFNINLFAAHTEEFDRDVRPGPRLGRAPGRRCSESLSRRFLRLTRKIRHQLRPPCKAGVPRDHGHEKVT